VHIQQASEQADGHTGILFAPQTVDALCAAVERFETMTFDHQDIAAHARRFDAEQFQQRMREVIG